MSDGVWILLDEGMIDRGISMLDEPETTDSAHRTMPWADAICTVDLVTKGLAD
jgi:predicted ATPase